MTHKSSRTLLYIGQHHYTSSLSFTSKGRSQQVYSLPTTNTIWFSFCPKTKNKKITERRDNRLVKVNKTVIVRVPSPLTLRNSSWSSVTSSTATASSAVTAPITEAVMAATPLSLSLQFMMFLLSLPLQISPRYSVHRLLFSGDTDTVVAAVL